MPEVSRQSIPEAVIVTENPRATALPTSSFRRAWRGLALEVGPMMSLAIPVVFSELGWMAMGVEDTMMVGRLGSEAIASVGIGNILFFSVAIFGIGMLLGMDTLVSQAFGAGKIDDCHRSLVQGVYLSLLMSIPLMGLILATIPVFRFAKFDAGVAEKAIAYIKVMIWGLPPLLAYFAVRRYLQGMNLVKPIMVSLVVANGVNILGNWLLVYGRLGFPALGVVGSSWATVVSRVVMFAILAGFAVWHGVKQRDGLVSVPLGLDRGRLRQLLSLGWPAAVQLTLEVGVFAIAAVLAGRFGAPALAAHEIVLQIGSVTFMVPLGVSSAGAVRVGQALGRSDPSGAIRSGWTALLLGAGFMAVSGLVLILVPGPILRLYNDEPDVIAIAGSLLVAVAIFQVFDGLQVVGTAILRGTGETRIPMFANLAAHWAIGLPIAYSLAVFAKWGVLGIWIGLASGLIAAGLILLGAWIWTVRGLSKG